MGVKAEQMEVLLQAAASDEPETQTLLDEMIVEHATPIIFKVVGQRLSSAPAQYSGMVKAETEDIYQIIVLKLLQRLREMLDSTSPEITDLKSYVAVIAHNVCNDVLRERAPERQRLKHKLRHLLECHPDFALWHVDDETVCGFSKLTGEATSLRAMHFSQLGAISREFREQCLTNADPNHLPLSTLITQLFNWLDDAVEFNTLIDLMMRVMGLHEVTRISLDEEERREESVLATNVSFDDPLEARAVLTKLWATLAELPLNQRRTFILMTHDETGESLLHRLLRERIVTPRQIYKTLAFTREQLTSLWDQLPLDTARAAEEQGVTKEMIRKWRHRALQKLRKVIGEES